ncbi:MAG: hypothetical protein ABI824_01795 [Acidobacteriota bacterium]
MFQPHQNLSDEINRRIIQSEIEGGVDLRRLLPRATLEVTTRNNRYVIVLARESEAWIEGHPQFCPEPVLCTIAGSNWGGSMIKSHYLGRGMHMEFHLPGHIRPIVTSSIVDIRMLSEGKFPTGISRVPN